MNPKDIIDLLALLTPYDILNFNKMRVGGPNDGGYVILDKLHTDQKIFSYGLSWNISFDLDLAQRGHDVYMFDHTISSLTVQHPLFHWFKEGISTQTDSLASLSTLGDHFKKLAHSEQNIILKIDIEGAEWKVLEEVPLDVLLCAEQIILELHNFSKINDEAWYTTALGALHKLSENFLLFHVHVNNCAPLVLINNIVIADVIEVSYIRKDLAISTSSQTIYPTHLDAPNNPDVIDFALLFYPFLPVKVDRLNSLIENVFFRLNDQLNYKKLTNKKEIHSTLIADQINNDPELVNFVVDKNLIVYETTLQNFARKNINKINNILIISVHPVLEFDEIRILDSLGYNVFSLGFYLDRNLDNELRPSLKASAWHSKCLQDFGQDGCTKDSEKGWLVAKNFLNNFDLVVVHHDYLFLQNNWSQIQDKRVIWRSVGQGVHWTEKAVKEFRDQGIRIVRWSPVESQIPEYVGGDAIIRGSKDPSEWSNWNGKTKRIITFNNDFQVRGDRLNFEFHQMCVDNQPFDLYGVRNHGIPNWRGVLSYEDQRKALRDYRATFITGSRPAPYSLSFIEAWMTGTPVIHVARNRFCGTASGEYEIDDFIINGVNGFLVETVSEAQEAFDLMLKDDDLAQSISNNGRKDAIALFDCKVARSNWQMFLQKLQ